MEIGHQHVKENLETGRSVSNFHGSSNCLRRESAKRSVIFSATRLTPLFATLSDQDRR